MSLLLSAVLPNAALAAPFCQQSQGPQFQFGFAALKSQLGDKMGDPIECEHADPLGTGDTEQHTTTGLAFFRKATNTPTFTNGFEHWALTADGQTYWTGTSVDPPFRPFVGRWTRRDTSLTVLPSGSAAVNWSTGVCSPGGPQPCDEFLPDGTRVFGGHADLTLTNATGVFLTAGSTQAPVLQGQVTSSTEPDAVAIGPVQLTLDAPDLIAIQQGFQTIWVCKPPRETRDPNFCNVQG